jgi:type VI secretion system protein ImpH
MSAFGWKQEASVAEWLFAEPWEFEFFQAVRLLELLDRERVPAGDGLSPDDEIVRFRSLVTQVFPASEVQAIRSPADPREPVEMTVNLSSLGGASGPLPAVDSERVIERTWRKDFASRDFLDMFHHRLLSLLVRTRKAHHPSYTALTPIEGPVARYLYAFFGLASPELHDRTGVADRSLVFYSGILSQHPRSASGLERLLADYFQVPAQVTQLLGQWRQLEPGGWTVIGSRGRNCGLGDGAILGTRVWDQQGGFEVNLGPMNLRAFLDFLPRGGGFGPLCNLTRFYAGPDLEFGFRLILQAAEVPGSRLGQSTLGWTSWLKTSPFTDDDSQVRLASRAPADPFSRFRMDTTMDTTIDTRGDDSRSAEAV